MGFWRIVVLGIGVELHTRGELAERRGDLGSGAGEVIGRESPMKTQRLILKRKLKSPNLNTPLWNHKMNSWKPGARPSVP